jgi:hypothetical protein
MQQREEQRVVEKVKQITNVFTLGVDEDESDELYIPDVPVQLNSA